MIKLKLTLDYQLAAGWLQPFTQGLIDGQPVAWRCSGCKRTSYPPERTCECGQTAGEWITLPGEAVIVHHTFGQDGQFALAKFQGADTSAVVKLHPSKETQDLCLPDVTSNLTGRLKPQVSNLPEVVLHIDPIKRLT